MASGRVPKQSKMLFFEEFSIVSLRLLPKVSNLHVYINNFLHLANLLMQNNTLLPIYEVLFFL